MIVVVERPLTTIFGGAVAAPGLPAGHVLRAAPLRHPVQRHRRAPPQGRRGVHLLGRDLMHLGDLLDDLTLDVGDGPPRGDATSRSTRATCTAGLTLLRHARAPVPRRRSRRRRRVARRGRGRRRRSAHRRGPRRGGPAVAAARAPRRGQRGHRGPPRGRRRPRGGHRHQRQDDRGDHGRGARAARRLERRQRRHAHQRAHDARPPGALPDARAPGRGLLARAVALGNRPGGLEPRARPGPRRRAVLRRGRVHQPRPRPPRLPRDDGAVLRGEGAALQPRAVAPRGRVGRRPLRGAPGRARPRCPWRPCDAATPAKSCRRGAAARSRGGAARS